MRIFKSLFGILEREPRVYVFKNFMYYGSENGVADVAKAPGLEVLAKQIYGLPGKPRGIINLVDAPQNIKKAIVARYLDAIGLRYSEIKDLRVYLEKYRKPEKKEVREERKIASDEDLIQERNKKEI